MNVLTKALRPGEGGKEKTVENRHTELLRPKLVWEKGEVTHQEVEEDVPKRHVIVGLHCQGQRHDEFIPCLKVCYNTVHGVMLRSHPTAHTK